MRTHLPPIFAVACGRQGAPLIHYKICSTFDSSPTTGSIGAAIEIGLAIFGNGWMPLITAAPAIHRYQAFGNLFATVAGTGYRLDRHPTMSRHPVTPMHEADLGRIWRNRRSLPTGIVDFVAMKAAASAMPCWPGGGRGRAILSLDIVDQETLAEAGRLVWEHREPLPVRRRFSGRRICADRPLAVARPHPRRGDAARRAARAACRGRLGLLLAGHRGADRLGRGAWFRGHPARPHRCGR